jgi:hypothetical protein
MRLIHRGILTAAALTIAGPATAQEVAPIFEQVPAVLYETYRGINNPAFDDYFEMLVGRYETSGGTGWSIYRESAKVAYRITALPEGMASLLPIQQARGTSFQDFTEDQVALWNAGWGSRHVSVWNAAPGMSVVPDGFTVEDIRALPYHRTTIYYLKWNQAGAFREALRARAALDREAGIDNYVLTAWNGGVGTPAQVVMVRISAEGRAADAGPNAEARRAARAGYIEEFRALGRTMSDASYRSEQHNQRRVARLSYTP